MDITDPRQTEEQFRMLAQAVEQSPVSIVITDRDGNIEYVNPQFTELTGYAMAEVRGQNPRLLKSGATPSEDYQTLWRTISSGQTWRGTLQNRKKNGQLYWERVSISPIFDERGHIAHYLGIKENISLLKAAEEALWASEERFRDFSALASDWFWEQDDQFRFTYFSKGWTMSGIEATGVDPAKFLGKTRWELPIDLTPEQWAAHRAVLEARQPFRDFEYPVLAESGERRWFSISGRPLFNAQGQFIGYRGAGRDITEHKRTLIDLGKAKEAAEQAAQAKANFLANMSHEIRTPMTAIMGMVDLCLQTELTEKQRHLLMRAQKATKALLRIINDILDFSKMEAGMLAVETVAFEFSQVLRQMETLLGPSAEKKGLRLTYALEPGLPPVLWGDPGRLSQVLINLAHNAIKFSTAGEVTVTVGVASREGNHLTLHLAVRDQGIGLAPEQQTRLFTAFSQADASTTRRFGGTGLGLAISQRLVNLMGGRIWVESRYGEGSTFHFTAQLQARADATRAGTDLARQPTPSVQPPAPEARVPRVALQGADILLVEDTELNQEVLRGLLENAGLRVRLASNGVEALRAVEAAVPDAVLMDCQMPVMDGLEASRQLRAQPRYRTLPIIALTANAMTEDRERCLAAGMNDHIAKPVKIDALLTTLARWVRPPGQMETIMALPPTSTEATARPWPELPGIDLQTGLELVGEQPAFYFKLLRLFRDTQGQSFASEIQKAIAAGDWPAVANLAHSLKGAAKTLGAFPLGESAARLEAAARTAQPEPVIAQLPLTLAELDQVMAGLARLGETDDDE